MIRRLVLVLVLAVGCGRSGEQKAGSGSGSAHFDGYLDVKAGDAVELDFTADGKLAVSSGSAGWTLDLGTRALVASPPRAPAPEARIPSHHPRWEALVSPTDDTIAISDLGSRDPMLDQIHSPARTVAWDPRDQASTHYAYWRAAPAELVVRDAQVRQDLETRPVTRVPAAAPIQIAWAPGGQRVAMLADGLVTLWDDMRAPVTYAFAGASAVELRADRTATLLGDATAARALLTCALHGKPAPLAECASLIR